VEVTRLAIIANMKGSHIICSVIETTIPYHAVDRHLELADLINWVLVGVVSCFNV
jgi:hypothetical protein